MPFITRYSVNTKEVWVSNWGQFLITFGWYVASIFLTHPHRRHYWLPVFRIQIPSFLVKEHNQQYYQSELEYASFLLSKWLQSVLFVALPFDFGVAFKEPAFIPGNEIVKKLMVFSKVSTKFNCLTLFNMTLYFEHLHAFFADVHATRNLAFTEARRQLSRGVFTRPKPGCRF